MRCGTETAVSLRRWGTETAVSPRRRSRSRAAIALACAAALLGASACGPPIRVVRVDAKYVQRSLTANVLSTGHASEWTRNIVNGWGLLDRYEKEPAAVLAELRAIVTSGRGGGSELFALSELSFLHAEKSKERPHYLAAAVYAYAFLIPRRAEDAPRAIDPRVRIAADLYNRAITQAFKGPAGTVELAPGRYLLPFGVVDVTMDPASARRSQRAPSRDPAWTSTRASSGRTCASRRPRSSVSRTCTTASPPARCARGSSSTRRATARPSR
jgi:hypothetical protein